MYQHVTHINSGIQRQDALFEPISNLYRAAIHLSPLLGRPLAQAMMQRTREQPIRFEPAATVELATARYLQQQSSEFQSLGAR